MENLKIRVNSKSESKEAQELFVKLGAACGVGEITSRWVCFYNGKITFYDLLPNVDFKEITLPELRAMANPMKEYLDSNRNYEFVLSTEKDDGFVEIPEGAEIAAIYGSSSIEFYKESKKEFFNNLDKVWQSYKGEINGAIVWQREQDEPFLTPETTLNDQYEEIEQVRQHKKHERNSSAWDVQVGGDHYKQFQIQPMQFALENKLDAAQQNVIKYIMRHSFKNGKQDLEKAKHYIDLMIEFYYGENNNG